MADKRIKRPRDPMQLAKLIGDIATGQVQDKVATEKNQKRAAAGKLGGEKGGKARAKKLSKDKRVAIAKKAVKTRWKKQKKKK